MSDIELQIIDIMSKLSDKQRIIYSISPIKKGWHIDYVMGNTDNPKSLLSSEHSSKMKALLQILRNNPGRNKFYVVIEQGE